MANQSFNLNEDIERAKAILRSKKSEEYFNDYFRLLVSNIKKIQSSNPNITLDELKENLIDDFIKKCECVYNFDNVYILYMNYVAWRYLAKNPSITNELVKAIQDGKKRSSSYKKSDDNFEAYLVNNAERLAKTYNDLQRKIDNIMDPKLEELYKHRHNDKNGIKKILTDKKMSQEEIDLTLIRISIYNKDFSMLIDDFKLIYEEELKEILVKNISLIYRNLSELGWIEKAERINSENFIKHDFGEFVEKANAFDMNDEDELMGCSTDSLMALASFWINRYQKVLENYANAIFSVYEFELLPDIMKCEDYKHNIDNKKIEEMLLKINLLMVKKQEFFNKTLKMLEEAPSDIIKRNYKESENGFLVSADGLIDSIYRAYGEEYVSRFYNFYSFKQNKKRMKKEEIQNIIEIDIDNIITLYGFVDNAYLNKSKLTMAFLANVEMNSSRSNAGLILNKEEIKNLKNGRIDISNKRFVGIGIDSMRIKFPCSSTFKNR